MTDPSREQRIAELDARAHNMRAAIPTRDEPTRYDRLSPLARALVDDYDEIDLAEMLVAAQDELARYRTVLALDAPLHDQLQAAVKALGRSETQLARVHQLLATGQIGCCAHLVRAALDQPAPAATEATDTRKEN